MRKEDKSILKKLFSINLIYAYPMLTSQAKAKMKKKQYFDFTKKIRMNYILASIFVVLMYSIFAIFVDFEQTPILLDCFIATIVVMSIIQNFIYFFNVFYESKDIESYMALPISERTVFLSKLLTVGFTGLQLSLPIATIFFIYFWQIGKSILFSIVFSVVDFVLIYFITMLINMILTLILAKLNAFNRYKNTITVVLMLIAMFINIGLIVSMQLEMRDALLRKYFTGVDTKYFISDLTISLGGQCIFIAVFGILAALGTFIVYRLMSSGFYNTIIKVNKLAYDEKKVIKVESKSRSVGRSLLKHNLNLLKDGTMLSQIIVMELMFLLMLGVSFITGGAQVRLFLSIYSNYLLPIMAVCGIFLGNTGNNFAAFCVSLDRESYNFIKSLPISRKRYVLFKIAFASFIQNVLVVLGIIALGIFLDAAMLDVILSIGIALLLGVGTAALWVVYDFKHLLLDWSGVTQLMTKVGRVIPFALMMGTMMLSGFLIGSIFVLEEHISVFEIYILLYGISIVICSVAFVKAKNLIKSNP